MTINRGSSRLMVGKGLWMNPNYSFDDEILEGRGFSSSSLSLSMLGNIKKKEREEKRE